MSNILVIRPIPFPVLALILSFAGLVGWFRYYTWTRKSAPLNKKARVADVWNSAGYLPPNSRNQCLPESQLGTSAVLAGVRGGFGG
jgi:hypothetical protein